MNQLGSFPGGIHDGEDRPPDGHNVLGFPGNGRRVQRASQRHQANIRRPQHLEKLLFGLHRQEANVIQTRGHLLPVAPEHAIPDQKEHNVAAVLQGPRAGQDSGQILAKPHGACIGHDKTIGEALSLAKAVLFGPWKHSFRIHPVRNKVYFLRLDALALHNELARAWGRHHDVGGVAVSHGFQRLRQVDDETVSEQAHINKGLRINIVQVENVRDACPSLIKTRRHCQSQRGGIN